MEITPEFLANWVEEAGDDHVGWWYLSFANPGFCRLAIVQAPGFTGAIATCALLGINPGGEVLGFPLHPATLPDPKFLYCLLTPEQLNEAFKQWGGACRFEGQLIEKAG